MLLLGGVVRSGFCAFLGFLSAEIGENSVIYWKKEYWLLT